MTRLIAFHIIGGTKHQPITKIIIAIDPEPGHDAFARTRYFFAVGKHDGYFDQDSILPSHDGESIYFMPCGEDLTMAESMFSECIDVNIAREWQQDDVACYGEDRLFQRAQP